MNKELVFRTYSNLLKQGVELLKNRRHRIIELANRPQSQSPDQALLNIFRNNSIEVYTKYALFVAEGIVSDDEVNDLFRIPSLRTLMDIYARFLYIHDYAVQDDQKFLKILSYQLLTFHVMGDTRDFKALLDLHAEILDKTKPDYPREWKEFNYEWLKQEKLLFPSWRSILSEEKMKKFSPQASKAFGARKQYEIFKHFSELIHGNPFVSHDSERKRYWLTALGLALTLYFLELIDGRIFFDNNQKDFRTWLRELKDNKHNLIEFWKEERGET